MLIKIILFIALFPPAAHAGEKLVAECSGRSYLHQIYLTNEAAPTPDSFRYERRMFFGNTLQESYQVRFEEADLFDRKFTFISFEYGALFAVTASETRKFLRGMSGRSASAQNYRQPGKGPVDYTGNCWIDFDLAAKLPARLSL